RRDVRHRQRPARDGDDLARRRRTSARRVPEDRAARARGQFREREPRGRRGADGRGGPAFGLAPHRPRDLLGPRVPRVRFAAASERDGAILLRRTDAAHPIDAYLAEQKLDDALATTLRREQHMFGLLLVANRSGDVSTFNGDDRTLFETFAAHAGVLLEND